MFFLVVSNVLKLIVFVSYSASAFNSSTFDKNHFEYFPLPHNQSSYVQKSFIIKDCKKVPNGKNAQSWNFAKREFSKTK